MPIKEAYEMTLNTTPVPEDPKCQRCLHYDGTAASKGGICEVGQFPTLCGNGANMRYGYAPLDAIGADQPSDLADPQVYGQPGVMNERGGMEPMVPLKKVTLGDEDIALARKFDMKADADVAKSLDWRGYTVPMGPERVAAPKRSMYDIAKAMRDEHFSPRKQRMNSLTAVLTFLKANGFAVTGEDLARAAE